MSVAEAAMLERLNGIEQRYEEIGARLGDPALIADQPAWQRQVKEHARLRPIVEAFRDYKRIAQGIREAEEMLGERLEEDFRALVRAELEEQKARLEPALQRLKLLLLPRDPNDERNVVVEVRAGTGGDEAGLFAADLARMYQRYAERMGWRTEVMDVSENEAGGVKEIVFVVEGEGAYSRLKFESGVHRVQRVPATEAQGRIHTSTATVAVLPEAEEVDVQIDPKDLQIDTFRAGGAGGQHVNKTESAIRITHLPTGIVVTSQDQRSQIQNREKAMRVLRSRLYEHLQQQQRAAVTEARRSQVGSGERSEKIRTYNFPQNRVTDHRIGLTLHKLDLIMDGDLGDLIDALITADQAERLKQVQ